MHATASVGRRAARAQVGTHGMFHDREYVADGGTLEWRPFHHTLEDLYNSVAQYYELSALSFRWARRGSIFEGPSPKP